MDSDIWQQFQTKDERHWIMEKVTEPAAGAQTASMTADRLCCPRIRRYYLMAF